MFIPTFCRLKKSALTIDLLSEEINTVSVFEKEQSCEFLLIGQNEL